MPHGETIDCTYYDSRATIASPSPPDAAGIPVVDGVLIALLAVAVALALLATRELASVHRSRRRSQ